MVMSEIINEEYFYQLNKRNSSWEICHIVFNPSNPNGFTRLVYRASYGRDSWWNYKQAKQFAKKLVKEFNSKRFRNRRVY